MIQYFIVKHNNYSEVGMDNSFQETTQPISDDQELAKALAGIGPDEPEVAAAPQFPELPGAQSPAPAPQDASSLPQPSVPPVVAAEPAPAVAPQVPGVPGDANSLEDIKRTALDELRPLVDRVGLKPEEKFDVYLMLIRSTDDTSLIAPAHATAQSIEDDKKKAEALLDIIKEIDYLSRKEHKQE